VVLVDSSAWILAEHQKIDIRSLLPPKESVATCPIIMQEVLRGTRGPAHYRALRIVFESIDMLDAPTPLERFEDAARVFLACRDAGITPRTSVDCLVVATAIAYGIPLLHDDRDFELISRILPLPHLRPTRS
jgi:predicted nucleic acid-binding protein